MKKIWLEDKGFIFGNFVFLYFLIMLVNCIVLIVINLGLNVEMIEFRSKVLKIRRRYSKIYCRVIWYLYVL